MYGQHSHKEQLLEAADSAEKKAGSSNEPGVKETMLALMALYRDLAKQVEELEMLRSSLHLHQ